MVANSKIQVGFLTYIYMFEYQRRVRGIQLALVQITIDL